MSDRADSADNEMLVALTFDMDPDHFDPSMADDYRSDDLTWRGVEEGVPAITEILSGVRDDNNSSPCATWLPRVDNQIGEIYGDCGAILDRFEDRLRELESEGHEIAWHPHLHRRESGTWVQEHDAKRLETNLVTAHDALSRRGWTPRATRMGGNYGSGPLMTILEGLGVEVDSSAMPGRQRRDDHVDFDWSKTPRTAYRPARNDYRIPGTPAHTLVEVPLSMAFVHASYDDQPYLRYVDLSFHTGALQPGLDDLIDDASYLVTDTHPSTVLAEVGSSNHGLLSFSLDAFRSNLDAIMEGCRRRDRPVRFVTLSDPRLRPGSDTHA
jgi:hypothetical protein